MMCLRSLAADGKSVEHGTRVADDPGSQRSAADRELAEAVVLTGDDDVWIAGRRHIEWRAAAADCKVLDPVDGGPSVVVVVPSEHDRDTILFEQWLQIGLHGCVVGVSPARRPTRLVQHYELPGLD